MPQLADVREQALAAAGAILKDYAGESPPGLEWQMHVTNDAQKTVFKLHFSMEEIAE